ncbi:MAG: hypothetical protein Hals2KO_33630 [Halioglobus sp.]
MYRNSANSEIIYTPEDLILYRESPFASWMERLTLENPDHGIAPDDSTERPCQRAFESCAHLRSERLDWQDFVSGIRAGEESATIEASTDLATALKQQGMDVATVGKHLGEGERRAATEAAMRRGAEYIANAHLALGPLACSTDLLIRSEGVSELGAYLYLPLGKPGSANTAGTEHTVHRLCFAADLLQSLQGVLPVQLLLMRAGEDINCLPTADHLERFLALKYAFMQAQLTFRKHRMPDPARSAHYGRWANCAQAVIKQRALSREVSEASVLQHNVVRIGRKGLADAMHRAIAVPQHQGCNNESESGSTRNRPGASQNAASVNLQQKLYG